MNKEELVDQVATDTGQTKKQAMVTVDAVFASIARALGQGRSYGGWLWDVSGEGAGRRDGRNPKTGDKIRTLEEVPAFTAGKDLKAEVN